MRYDFALLFTALTLLSGGIWLFDALLFGKARRKAIAEEGSARDKILEARVARVRAIAEDSRIEGVRIARENDAIAVAAAGPADATKLRIAVAREMPDMDVAADGGNLAVGLKETAPRTREPVAVEYARSFFPVILVILLVRSFLGEPYRIPSESMMPNLLIGDFILVNKYAYGLRLPVLDTKIVKVGEPRRGDVIVFHPPMAPDQVWIKRVIGLPGDTIAYDNYRLSVNGKPVDAQELGVYQGSNSGADMSGSTLVREDLPGRPHTILQTPERLQFQSFGTWVVPSGHYFMMGDNRDNSEDSRFWKSPDGQPLFLSEQDIVGKAELIWMNYDFGAWKMDSSRIGTKIR